MPLKIILDFACFLSEGSSAGSCYLPRRLQAGHSQCAPGAVPAPKEDAIVSAYLLKDKIGIMK